jgi:hypothetical protein
VIPWSRYNDALRPDKLSFQLRFTIFQEHLNDLFQIAIQFIKGLPLGMSPAQTWNIPDKKPRIRYIIEFWMKAGIIGGLSGARTSSCNCLFITLNYYIRFHMEIMIIVKYR